jgi:hypothetical protein
MGTVPVVVACDYERCPSPDMADTISRKRASDFETPFAPIRVAAIAVPKMEKGVQDFWTERLSIIDREWQAMGQEDHGAFKNPEGIKLSQEIDSDALDIQKAFKAVKRRKCSPRKTIQDFLQP